MDDIQSSTLNTIRYARIGAIIAGLSVLIACYLNWQLVSATLLLAYFSVESHDATIMIATLLVLAMPMNLRLISSLFSSIVSVLLVEKSNYSIAVFLVMQSVYASHSVSHVSCTMALVRMIFANALDPVFAATLLAILWRNIIFLTSNIFQEHDSDGADATESNDQVERNNQTPQSLARRSGKQKKKCESLLSANTPLIGAFLKCMPIDVDCTSLNDLPSPMSSKDSDKPKKRPSVRIGKVSGSKRVTELSPISPSQRKASVGSWLSMRAHEITQKIGFGNHQRSPSGILAAQQRHELDLILVKMRLFLERFSGASLSEAPREYVEQLVYLLSDASACLHSLNPEFKNMLLNSNSNLDETTRDWLAQMLGDSSTTTRYHTVADDAEDDLKKFTLPTSDALSLYEEDDDGVDDDGDQSDGNTMEYESKNQYRIVSIHDGELNLELLKHDQWDFDVFNLNEQSQGFPCQALGIKLFEVYKIYDRFPTIHRNKVNAFFHLINNYYRDLPYHNSIHGADVAQAMHCLMSHTPIGKYATDISKLTMIIASICHDVDHPGVTNAFLIGTQHELAVLYNDISVLENHHAAQTIRLLMTHPDCTFLDGMPVTDRQMIRKMLVKAILATDLAKHVDLVNAFKARKHHLKKAVESQTLTEDDRSQVLGLALKCCDIGHPLRPRHLHLKWNDRINAEFFRQGDMERELGLPVSAFMDRNTTLEWKSQLGFIEFFVQPLWKTLADFMEDVAFDKGPVHQLEANRDHWNQIRLEYERQHKEVDQSVKASIA